MIQNQPNQVNHSTNQLANQPTNNRTNQQTNPLATQPINPATNQRSNQTTSSLVGEVVFVHAWLFASSWD
jgi:hypothetical protein